MIFRLAFLIVCFAVRSAQAAPPVVLASIAPLHSVVAAVADGVFVPQLLLSPAVSVHDYALKPSDMRKIAKADIVFYGGKTLEGFLPKAIESAKAKGVSLLQDGDNPHFWLSPSKMARAAEKIAETLAQSDAEHAALYRENAKRFVETANDLIAQGREILSSEQNKPFIVFHDAYREFEREFGLHGIGAVKIDAHRATGAAHLTALREKIRENGTVCLFSEPQMNTRRLETVREGLSVVDGVLDPLGAEIETGKDFYPRLIRNLISSFKQCLQQV